MPGGHVLAFPSSPDPQGLQGKGGFLCGEGWWEMDAAAMSRGVLWHHIIIPDTQLEVFRWGTGDVNPSLEPFASAEGGGREHHSL